MMFPRPCPKPTCVWRAKASKQAADRPALADIMRKCFKDHPDNVEAALEAFQRARLGRTSQEACSPTCSLWSLSSHCVTTHVACDIRG